MADTQTDDVQLEAGTALDALPDGNDVETLASGEDQPEIGATPGPDDLYALQSIINRQSSRLDELKLQIKQLNESMKAIFENDAQLSAAEEELKETSKRHKERKASLAQSPESTQLKFKLTEVRDQIKDLEESLNNHLLNFFQMTGTKFVDTDAGQREFAVRAKLLSAKKDQQ